MYTHTISGLQLNFLMFAAGNRIWKITDSIPDT